MTIPLHFSQVNIQVTGTALPTGAEMTFGVSNPTDFPPDQVGGFVATNWDTAVVQAFFASTSAITAIKVKNGTDATGPSAVFGCNLPGLGSATAVPPNVSILVHKITGAGGRQGRGRMYMPCWVEGTVDHAGVVDATLRANLQTNLNNFRIAMAADDLPLVLLHGDLLTPYPIDILTVDTRAATQRRRLRR